MCATRVQSNQFVIEYPQVVGKNASNTAYHYVVQKSDFGELYKHRGGGCQGQSGAQRPLWVLANDQKRPQSYRQCTGISRYLKRRHECILCTTCGETGTGVPATQTTKLVEPQRSQSCAFDRVTIRRDERPIRCRTCDAAEGDKDRPHKPTVHQSKGPQINGQVKVAQCKLFRILIFFGLNHWIYSGLFSSNFLYRRQASIGHGCFRQGIARIRQKNNATRV